MSFNAVIGKEQQENYPVHSGQIWQNRDYLVNPQYQMQPQVVLPSKTASLSYQGIANGQMAPVNVSYVQQTPLMPVYLNSQQFQASSHQGILKNETEEKLQLMIIENQKLNAALNDKILELEASKLKNARANLNVSETRVYQTKIVELESLLSDATAELEIWQRKYLDLESQLSAHNQRVSMVQVEEKSLYSQEVQRLNSLLAMKSAEAEELRLRASGLENEFLRDLQARFVIMASENERLHDILRENMSEFSRFQETIAELNGQLAIVSSSAKDGRHLQSTIEELRGRIHSQDIEISHLSGSESRLKEAEIKIARLAMEIDSNRTILMERESEIRNLRTKLSNESEVSSLKNQLRYQEEEFERMRINLNASEKTVSELKTTKNRLNEFEVQVNSLNSEIFSLQGKLRAKEEELVQIRVSMTKSEFSSRELSFLQNENNRLNAQLDERSRELATLRNELSKLNSLNFSLQSENRETLEKIRRIELQEKEIQLIHEMFRSISIRNSNLHFSGNLQKDADSLSLYFTQSAQQLSERDRKISELQSALYESENNFRSTSNTQFLISQRENDLKVMTQELEKTKAFLAQREEELASWRITASKAEANAVSYGEISRLEALLQQKSQEIAYLEKQLLEASNDNSTLNEYKLQVKRRMLELFSLIVILCAELEACRSSVISSDTHVVHYSPDNRISREDSFSQDVGNMSGRESALERIRRHSMNRNQTPGSVKRTSRFGI